MKFNTPLWIGIFGLVASCFLMSMKVGESRPGYVVTWDVPWSCFWIFGPYMALGFFAGINHQKNKP